MNIDEINPYIRGAVPCILKNASNVRIILDYELIYVEEGILKFTYNNTIYHFTKGDFFSICPGIPHTFACVSEQVSVPHIHFDLVYDQLSTKRFICFKNLNALSPDEQRLISQNAFPALANNPLLSIKNKDRFLKTLFTIINNRNPQDLSRKSQMLELINMIITDNRLFFLK